MNRIQLFLIGVVAYIALHFCPAVMAQTQATPQITALAAANTYQITWPGTAGRLYFIQFSTDLQTWTYAPAVNLGTGANIAYGFSSTTARSYARLKYSIATNNTQGNTGDADGDGLSNINEVSVHFTDPFSADTDSDGLRDDHELSLAKNPNLRDTDADGIEDPWETFDPASFGQNLVISEFQAANTSTVADEDNDYSDWIEILNPTNSQISLNGWYLTDRPGGDGQVPNLTKWQFPDGITLNPGQVLQVWASGKNRGGPGQPLHTGFSLDAADEGVGLVNPQPSLVDSFRWTTAQLEDRSTGWGIDTLVGSADGKVRKVRFFGIPTPGTLNTEIAYTGVCPVPLFTLTGGGSANGGIYSGASFNINITAPGGLPVRYTTDFTMPTASSPLATGAITVSPNTIIRAMTSAPNCLPSPVVTRSFLFTQKVMGTAPQGTQPTDHQVKPGGYPDGTSQAPFTLDYAMDPVRIAADKNQMVNDLTAIPTVSIVLPSPQFFDVNAGGIYANASLSANGNSDPLGQNWKRVASIEYIDMTTGVRDQETGEMDITGGSSIDPSTTPKHSMRMEFRKRVSSNAEGVMNFLNAPLPSSSLKKFRTLMLRSPTHDSWVLRWGGWLREESTHIKESWARATHSAMNPYSSQNLTGNLIAHRRWVHLYINALYWGVYEIGERVNEDFMQAYSQPTYQYDVISQGADAENGNIAAWTEMLRRCDEAAAEPGSNAKWQAVVEMLDINNYADYLMVNLYMHNVDWPHNNYRAVRRKDLDDRSDPDAVIYASGANAQKFRFLIWDAEYAMQHSVVNAQSLFLQPFEQGWGAAAPHRKLRDHPSYRAAWKLRAAAHFDTAGGVFSVTGGTHAAVTRWEQEATLYESAVRCESGRWGDGARTPAYTRADWLVNKNYKSNTWLPQRRASIRSQFVSAGLANP